MPSQFPKPSDIFNVQSTVKIPKIFSDTKQKKQHMEEAHSGCFMVGNGWMFVRGDASYNYVQLYSLSLFTDSAGGLIFSFQSDRHSYSILRELMDSCREKKMKKRRRKEESEVNEEDGGLRFSGSSQNR